MPLLFALGLSTAFADEPTQEAGRARIYGNVRGTVAVPTGYAGLAQSYGVEIGALFRSGNQLGLRFAWLPDPPDVYGADATPNNAVGPVLTWAYHARVSPRFDIYPTLGVGAVFGPEPDTGINRVLPYLQAGVGMQGRIPMGNGGAIGVGPEIGLVPTILAPYVALNLSVIGPRPAAVTGDDW